MITVDLRESMFTDAYLHLELKSPVDSSLWSLSRSLDGFGECDTGWSGIRGGWAASAVVIEVTRVTSLTVVGVVSACPQ